MWKYGYIDDDKYANYTRTCERRNFQEYLEDLDDNDFFNVIAVPTEDEKSDQSGERVVSLAFWSLVKHEDLDALQITYKLRAIKANCSERPDINMTRALDLEQQFERVALPYIANLTEPQLYLGLLATHPDFDGCGYGAAQVEIGLKRAAHASMPVTLISTPAGYPLYDELGFRSIANLTFVMLDHLGTLWEEYMRWDAEPDVY